MTKVSLVLKDPSVWSDTMIPAYFPSEFGYKRGDKNTTIRYVLMFVLLRPSDKKKRFEIKCEGEFEIQKPYERINMKDLYDQFKKGADHIADWIIENEVTSVRPKFPNLDKFSPYLKKLWEEAGGSISPN